MIKIIGGEYKGSKLEVPEKMLDPHLLQKENLFFQ